MNYKTYYQGIKEQLAKYSDVVYYEPMSEKKIQAIEKQKRLTIKPLFREYLLAFGFTQDVFENVTSLQDSWLEDVEFIEDSYPNYLPIFCDIDEEDTLYLINNVDLEDDFVYRVAIENDEPTGTKVKHRTFQSLIEEGIMDLARDHKNRFLNTEKSNVFEFKFKAKHFATFLESLKNEGLSQKTNWKAKYFPDNIFGDEVAGFVLLDKEFPIERDADCKFYEFELEESVFTKKKDSMITKTKKLLKAHKIKYKMTEYRGI